MLPCQLCFGSTGGASSYTPATIVQRMCTYAAMGRKLSSYLNCPNGPPELPGNFRFNPSELKRIQAKLTTHVAALCGAWKEMHGNH